MTFLCFSGHVLFWHIYSTQFEFGVGKPWYSTVQCTTRVQGKLRTHCQSVTAVTQNLHSGYRLPASNRHGVTSAMDTCNARSCEDYALCIVQLNMHYCGAPPLVIIGSHCKWSKWILGCYTKLISCSDLISVCSICILPPHWSLLILSCDACTKDFPVKKIKCIKCGWSNTSVASYLFD